jgi:hypothetical protein
MFIRLRKRPRACAGMNALDGSSEALPLIKDRAKEDFRYASADSADPPKGMARFVQSKGRIAPSFMANKYSTAGMPAGLHLPITLSP